MNQSLVRSRLSTLAQGFSGLSAPQVASWNQFAQGYPAKNKLGDSYTPTGKQVYMLCNLNLFSIGLPKIDTPPYDVPVVPGISIEAAETDITADAGPPTSITELTTKEVTSDTPTAVIVYQYTPPMQASRQSYRNRMRQIHFQVQGVNPTGTVVAAAYNAYFGTPQVTEGQIINVRVAAVDVDSGVASSWVYLQGVIPTPA